MDSGELLHHLHGVPPDCLAELITSIEWSHSFIRGKRKRSKKGEEGKISRWAVKVPSPLLSTECKGM